MEEHNARSAGKSSKRLKQKIVPFSTRRKKQPLLQNPEPKVTLDTKDSPNIKQFNDFLRMDYKQTAENFQHMLNEWIEDM